MAEHMLSMYKALSLIPNTRVKERQRERDRGREREQECYWTLAGHSEGTGNVKIGSILQTFQFHEEGQEAILNNVINSPTMRNTSRRQ